MRSSGVNPGPTSPRSDLATPTIAALPQGSSLFRHEDRHGFVVFLAHLERYALADLYLFGGHALDPAHHHEALHEIHEHDVVRLAVPVMHGGRRVDGPPPVARLPGERGASTVRAEEPRVEDRFFTIPTPLEAELPLF